MAAAGQLHHSPLTPAPCRISVSQDSCTPEKPAPRKSPVLLPIQCTGGSRFAGDCRMHTCKEAMGEKLSTYNGTWDT